MRISTNALVACLAVGGLVVDAVDPAVTLDYATYEGTALGNGITQWLGVRFAAPPVGELRFAAPLPPNRERGTVRADAPGKLCLSTGTDGSDPPDDEHDEDCLFLSVFAPSNATAESKLPVYFFIQGGGFNGLSNPTYNGSGIIMAAEYDAIVVQINYRVGLFGFLASSEIAQSASVNNGLKDQRLALRWVQKYISRFGGNPDHVVLGGASAGAQSVCLHVTAYGGRDDGLFHATAAESQSFPPIRTIQNSEFIYTNVAIRTGCVSSPSILACLRNRTAADIQSVNSNFVWPGAQEPPIYMYGPTLDNDFIQDLTTTAYATGRFVRVPAIYGDDTNEGTVFTPRNTSSYAASNTFLQNNFPALTPSQLGLFNSLYPVESTPSFPSTGRFWRQAANQYGELRYNCPGLHVSAALTRYRVPSYNYHWNVIDPPAAASGVGVSHTVELNAIWGPANTGPSKGLDSYRPGGVNAPVVPLTQAYWASFIRSFDPNRYRAPGAPRWDEYQSRGLDGLRLKFETNATRVERVDAGQQKRCAALLAQARALGQ